MKVIRILCWGILRRKVPNLIFLKTLEEDWVMMICSMSAAIKYWRWILHFQLLPPPTKSIWRPPTIHASDQVTLEYEASVAPSVCVSSKDDTSTHCQWRVNHQFLFGHSTMFYLQKMRPTENSHSRKIVASKDIYCLDTILIVQEKM